MMLSMMLSMAPPSTFALLLISLSLNAQGPGLQIVMDTAQPEAALAILEKGDDAGDADWQRLFTSEGYVRLKRREESMARSFTDSDFKKFLLTREMRAQTLPLRAILDDWKQASLQQAAALAFAYLPPNATIHATIYPVIKPAANSFVFETGSNPTIFLYLDPHRSQAKFINTVAHELHHIGFATSCPPPALESKWSALPIPIRDLHRWIGAYGEGFAMLAAAGGVTADPQPADRNEWKEEMDHFNEELSSQNQFFVQILEAKITDSVGINDKMATYFGNQGLWYAVGWRMAVTIEEVFGRDRLIQAMCSHDSLFATYNQAAKNHNRNAASKLALWSEKLVQGIRMAQSP